MKLATPKITFGTRFQQGLDGVIGTFAPKMQLQRMESRAKIARLHQYAGAETGRERRPPRSLRNPDSLSAQSDGVQMIRRAQDLVRDSAFIGHLIRQYRIYVLGDLSYIPAVGDKATNRAYRDYWKNWMLADNCDAQGRFHFIDFIQLMLAGVFTNGRHGAIHHHNHTEGTFKLQSVMGYNIGNPNTVYSNPRLIQGVELDDEGRPIAYHLYRLTISGMVQYVDTIPAIIFSCLNPVSSADEYVAKTPFHAVLNDAQDVYETDNAWKMKIKKAAYITAIYNTPNGAAPDANPNDAEGNLFDGGYMSPARGRVVQELPGQELIGPEGFNVEMLKNENPTNNETGYIDTKLAHIASALCLPLPFVWHMMGVSIPGTMTRLVSEQAKRAFQHGPFGQEWMERNFLNEIKNKALWSGIQRGLIPYVKDWDKGNFMYPAHPTVDVGRESKANLDENRQGMLSMAEICAERGRYWEDVDEELAQEALNKLEKARDVSFAFGEQTTYKDTLPLIQSMSPNPPSPGETGAAQEESPPAK